MKNGAYVPNPNYSDVCATNVLKRNALPFLADAAGLIPGETTAVGLAKIGGAVVSGAVNAWRGDLTGAGLGYGNVNTELFGPSGAGRGIEAAKYVPGIGTGLSLVSLGRDLHHTTRDFLKCGE